MILNTYSQLNDIYNEKENNQPCIDFLKLPREDAVLDSARRLFHSLAPRKEKYFCPFAAFILPLILNLFYFNPCFLFIGRSHKEVNGNLDSTLHQPGEFLFRYEPSSSSFCLASALRGII